MKEIFVQSEKTIKVSKNKLLEEIRKPGNLVNFHPFCKENHVEKWSGEGSIDYVKYLNDLTYKRKFLEWNDFHDFSKKLIEKKINFIIEPYIRFEGLPGEQATMFFKDPCGNALEFKSFKDLNKIFEK